MVGSRFSANWCSVKPPTTRTHCGGGVTATWRFSMLMASARLRTPSQRSSMLKLSPPRMMWRWLSIRPGRTRRPLRSTTLVFGPASAITSLSRADGEEAAVPDRDGASRSGCARSSVVKRP